MDMKFEICDERAYHLECMNNSIVVSCCNQRVMKEKIKKSNMNSYFDVE